MDSLQFDPCPRAGEPMVSRRKWSLYSTVRGEGTNISIRDTRLLPLSLHYFPYLNKLVLSSLHRGEMEAQGIREPGGLDPVRLPHLAPMHVRSTANSHGKPLCGEKAARGTAHRLPCSGWTHEYSDMNHRIDNARKAKCPYDFPHPRLLAWWGWTLS